MMKWFLICLVVFVSFPGLREFASPETQALCTLPWAWLLVLSVMRLWSCFWIANNEDIKIARWRRAGWRP